MKIVIFGKYVDRTFLLFPNYRIALVLLRFSKQHSNECHDILGQDYQHPARNFNFNSSPPLFRSLRKRGNRFQLTASLPRNNYKLSADWEKRWDSRGRSGIKRRIIDASAVEGSSQGKRREVSLIQRSFCFGGRLAREKLERMPTVADLRAEIDELSIHGILQTRMVDQSGGGKVDLLPSLHRIFTKSV